MNIKNTSLRFLALASLSATVDCQTSTKKVEKKLIKPNVVVICLDDLGYGDLSCYCGVGLKTPNIPGQISWYRRKQHRSKEFLDVLMGTSDTGRESLVLEANTKTALRKGDWIMIPPYKGPAINKETNIELGNLEEYQLYNLKEDIGQQNNLAKANPEKLKEMLDAFIAIRGEGFEKTEELKLH